MTEAARSKEDIEAAQEQLQKFPNKNDVSFYLAVANLSFSGGDLSTAVNALQQALAADPKSSAAHMAMGDLYLFQKDQKQAIEEYKKAADLAPIRSVEKLKYAAFKSATGGAEETRRVATEMTKQAPDYLPGWILLAELASKDKKYDEALSLLENVFSREPEYVRWPQAAKRYPAGKGRAEKSNRGVGASRSGPIQALRSSNTNWHVHISAIMRSTRQRTALDQAISANPNYHRCDPAACRTQSALGSC